MGNRIWWIGCLLGTAMTSISTCSLAQATPQTETDAEHVIQDGYRTARFADGFQLVEHGFWAPPTVAPTSQAAAFQKGRAFNNRSEIQPAFPSSGFRRAGYLPHIYAAEAKYALPTGLLDALVWTESRYNPLAVSRAGAAGLGQLMPATAKDLGIGNRFDPLSNIDGAARYLRQMIDKFGVVHLALAAYNAGPRAVERAGGIPRNGETPAYVRNVLRSWRF